mgnify:CR=1
YWKQAIYMRNLPRAKLVDECVNRIVTRELRDASLVQRPAVVFSQYFRRSVRSSRICFRTAFVILSSRSDAF